MGTKSSIARGLLLTGLALGALVLTGASAHAASIIHLSTSTASTLGGQTIQNEDILEYDDAADTGTLFFDGSGSFTANERIDALHILDNGNIVLSTVNAATLGGTTFQNGDIVEYDPVNDTLTVLLSQSVFDTGSINVDAVFVMDNGNFVLSTQADEQLAGVAFLDGDLVEYDPVNDVASIFFSESNFSAGEDVDAVHVMTNGDIILSTTNQATLGGVTFQNGDLVRYDPVNDISTLFFSETNFSADEQIDGVFVPEPSTGVLLALGLVGLALFPNLLRG